jgi:hypothetical protein
MSRAEGPTGVTGHTAPAESARGQSHLRAAPPPWLLGAWRPSERSPRASGTSVANRKEAPCGLGTLTRMSVISAVRVRAHPQSGTATRPRCSEHLTQEAAILASASTGNG